MGSKLKRKRNKVSAALLAVSLLVSLLPSTVGAVGGAISVDKAAAAVTESSSGVTNMSGSVEAGLDPEQAKVTKEEAIEFTRSLFPVLEKAEVRQVDLGNPNSYPPQQEMIWTIQWNYSKGNSSHGFSTATDAMTGDLIQAHIYFWDQEEEQSYYPPKVSRKDAAELAKQFIAKAAPGINMDLLEENERQMMRSGESLFGPVRYYYHFRPIINNVPSNADSISVEVSGNGDIISFNRSGQSLEYPDSTPAVSQAEAEKKFEDSLQLELAYMVEQSGMEKDWFLGWKQKSLIGTIDAQSGDYIDYSGNIVDPTVIKYEEIEPMDNGFKARTSTKLLTSEEAAAIVAEKIGVPEGRTVDSQRIGQYWNRQGNNDIWTLYWRNKEQMPYGPYEQTFAAIDAKTGQIYEYRENQVYQMNNESQDEEPSIDNEEAKRIATDIILRNVPDASENLKQRVMHQPNISNGQEQFSFSYIRFYKDLPVEDGGVQVSLDRDGNILSFYAVGEQDLEEKLDVLNQPMTTEKQAKAKYLEGTSMKLQFVRLYSANQSKPSHPIQAKLVYQLIFEEMSYGYAIDAATGEWRSPGYYRQQEEVGTAAVDTEGHWAEEQLTTLLQYGILKPDEEGRIQPDAVLTKGDWYEMLAQAVDPYYNQYYNDRNQEAIFADVNENNEYYPALNWAVQRQMLAAEPEQSFEPEKPLSRSELAVQLVHFLRYHKLSKYMNDSEEDTGAILIAIKLGLMTTSNNEFNANRVVTRAEASVVLMRLVYLQGKTDHR